MEATQGGWQAARREATETLKMTGALAARRVTTNASTRNLPNDFYALRIFGLSRPTFRCPFDGSDTCVCCQFARQTLSQGFLASPWTWPSTCFISVLSDQRTNSLDAYAEYAYSVCKMEREASPRTADGRVLRQKLPHLCPQLVKFVRGDDSFCDFAQQNDCVMWLYNFSRFGILNNCIGGLWGRSSLAFFDELSRAATTPALVEVSIRFADAMFSLATHCVLNSRLDVGAGRRGELGALVAGAFDGLLRIRSTADWRTLGRIDDALCAAVQVFPVVFLPTASPRVPNLFTLDENLVPERLIQSKVTCGYNKGVPVPQLLKAAKIRLYTMFGKAGGQPRHDVYLSSRSRRLRSLQSMAGAATVRFLFENCHLEATSQRKVGGSCTDERCCLLAPLVPNPKVAVALVVQWQVHRGWIPLWEAPREFIQEMTSFRNLLRRQSDLANYLSSSMTRKGCRLLLELLESPTFGDEIVEHLSPSCLPVAENGLAQLHPQAKRVIWMVTGYRCSTCHYSEKDWCQRPLRREMRREPTKSDENADVCTSLSDSDTACSPLAPTSSPTWRPRRRSKKKETRYEKLLEWLVDSSYGDGYNFVCCPLDGATDCVCVAFAQQTRENGPFASLATWERALFRNALFDGLAKNCVVDLVRSYVRYAISVSTTGSWLSVDQQRANNVCPAHAAIIRGQRELGRIGYGVPKNLVLFKFNFYKVFCWNGALRLPLIPNLSKVLHTYLMGTCKEIFTPPMLPSIDVDIIETVQLLAGYGLADLLRAATNDEEVSVASKQVVELCLQSVTDWNSLYYYLRPGLLNGTLSYLLQACTLSGSMRTRINCVHVILPFLDKKDATQRVASGPNYGVPLAYLAEAQIQRLERQLTDVLPRAGSDEQQGNKINRNPERLLVLAAVRAAQMFVTLCRRTAKVAAALQRRKWLLPGPKLATALAAELTVNPTAEDDQSDNAHHDDVAVSRSRLRRRDGHGLHPLDSEMIEQMKALRLAATTDSSLLAWSRMKVVVEGCCLADELVNGPIGDQPAICLDVGDRVMAALPPRAVLLVEKVGNLCQWSFIVAGYHDPAAIDQDDKRTQELGAGCEET